MGENSLSPANITRNLGTRFIGQRVIYYPRLTSTMEIAKREVQQEAVEGTVVIAGEQTAGKGRINRTWLSPKGSLALSVILYPAVTHLPFLIMLASLAVVRSVKGITGLRTQIKWPNDILINDKKVCGILIESGVRGNFVDYSLIGIGANINLQLAAFSEISPTATSLSHELGQDISLVAIIQQLLIEIERLYLSLPAGESIYEEWRDSLVTLGKRVQIKSAGRVYAGLAETVARDGSLLLRQSDGSLINISAGDVNHQN